MSDNDKLNRVTHWAFGNGSEGADERIRKNTDALTKHRTGDIECMAHNRIKEHISWHKQNKRFLWAILVPVYLTVLTLVLQLIGVID